MDWTSIGDDDMLMDSYSGNQRTISRTSWRYCFSGRFSEFLDLGGFGPFAAVLLELFEKLAHCDIARSIDIAPALFYSIGNGHFSPGVASYLPASRQAAL